MRLIHLSDLHFGAVDPRLPDRLRAAVIEAKPDLVAISGDLTQRGLRKEFLEAKSFLSSIPLPQVVVPGNHDVQGTWRFWERFLAPLDNYRSIIGPNLEPVWKQPGVTVIGANSARPAGWYWDWSRGRLSRRQLAQLAKSYTPAKPDELRVLVVHHPPAAPPGGTARHLIGRLQEFSDAVNRIGVDLVLSGHFHMSYAQALPLQGGSAPRACVLSAVSTATSRRLAGEPNGFHFIWGTSSELRIQDWSWNGEDYYHRRSWAFSAEPGKRNWRPA